MSRSMHCLLLALIMSAVLVSFAYSRPVLAQSSQITFTTNLTYLMVKLSFPSEVMPGDSVTVNLLANARKTLGSVSLTAQIFYSDGSNLHQLTSATVSNNYMSSGSSLSKQIQFTVPQDAPRTSLVASLSESVQITSYSYYYSPYYYNYSNPNCYYYYGSCTYYGYSYPYTYAYPSSPYGTTTDSAVAPLSYIKATTPEYISLQSQYQALQQQLAQSQAENQQLNQNLQNAQNTNAQQNATIANLNQQLSSRQGTVSGLEVAAVALLVIAIGLFAALMRKGKAGPPAKAAGVEEAKS